MIRLELLMVLLVWASGAYGQVSRPPSIPLSSEAALEGGVVTGIPFSAEATTQIAQTFPDGNRIVRTTKAIIARDSVGRTRRNQSLSSLGSFLPGGQSQTFTVIRDPVARLKYVVRPDQQFAERMSLSLRQRQFKEPNAGARLEPAAAAELIRGANIPEDAKVKLIAVILGGSEPGQATSTALGERTIQGVQATGTRVIKVIPAGEIGNQQPMTITSEVWYSAELQVVVLSSQSDPRVGETTFMLSGIELREPPRSLFEVPSAYRIVEAAESPR